MNKISIIWLYCLFLITSSRAQQNLGPRQVGMSPAGPIMQVEIPFQQFMQNFVPQGNTEWCWAASISNIFAYYGHPISQQRIVETVYGQEYGQAPNLPAFTGAQIAQQVNRIWTDDNGKTFKATLTAAYDYDAHVYAINNLFIVNELSHGRPLLICNTQHCMALTLVDYTGQGVIRAGVFDPWPNYQPPQPPARTLTAAEITPIVMGGQMRFIAAFRVEDIP